MLPGNSFAGVIGGLLYWLRRTLPEGAIMIATPTLRVKRSRISPPRADPLLRKATTATETRQANIDEMSHRVQPYC